VNALTIASLSLVLLVACTSGSDDSMRAGRSPDANGTRSATNDEDRPEGSGGPGGSGGGEAPEAASLTVEERKSDATSSGDVTGYPELSSATLEGSDEGVTIELGFARAVPQKVPAGVRMTVAFSIIDAEGNRYLLNALSDDGWTVGVVTSAGQAEFGGRFDISGKRVTIGIPWTDLGGPRPFNWIASSAWTGNPEKGTSYAFDSIPDSGFSGFPKTTGNQEKSP
jgi:hypothetical protein